MEQKKGYILHAPSESYIQIHQYLAKIITKPDNPVSQIDTDKNDNCGNDNYQQGLN